MPTAESTSPEPENDEGPVGHEGLQKDDGDRSGLPPSPERIAEVQAPTAADAKRFAEEFDGEQATGLAEFYTTAHAALRGVAKRHVRILADQGVYGLRPEDLINDAMAQVIDKRKFEPRNGGALGYLFNAVRFAAYAAFSQERRHLHVVEEQLDDAPQVAEEAEFDAAVAKAVDERTSRAQHRGADWAKRLHHKLTDADVATIKLLLLRELTGSSSSMSPSERKRLERFRKRCQEFIEQHLGHLDQLDRNELLLDILRELIQLLEQGEGD